MIWCVRFLEAYAATGLVFAAAFIWLGIGRVDPVARTGSLGFRTLVLPGAAALWPLLLHRWRASASATHGEGDRR